ncbi:hypothetical protein WPS_17330 [Vulcanimicrobium alpinum]|uniref:Uncharacterized protein n=1 Tax=Vulcanimicrobium alpinum TaxID=3016050 RepID=A0AAN1XY93_UNVUL|nr:hypothetical protein [Vulcanimicrobium alpinum]BDE06457.1 hypothetical protein WPS_17330 [Vulcanimicrobium alpinum]
MIVPFALAIAIAAGISDAATPRVRYFLGSWHCAAVPWTYTPLDDGDAWVRVTYGAPAHPDGTAVMGYVAGLQRFIYRDFHADGAYADLTSPATSDRTFVWSGPYWPAGATTPAQGRITYTLVDERRFDRAFATQLADGSLKPMGGDTCTRDAPSR